MANTNAKQTNGGKPCGNNVHYTPVYPHKPCTTRPECVTCYQCLDDMNHILKDVAAGGDAWSVDDRMIAELTAHEYEARARQADDPERYDSRVKENRPDDVWARNRNRILEAQQRRKG